jgi:hypothetical protein
MKNRFPLIGSRDGDVAARVVSSPIGVNVMIGVADNKVSSIGIGVQQIHQYVA